jgi:glycosyltransferase involved in cell wall biosynthesis
VAALRKHSIDAVAAAGYLAGDAPEQLDYLIARRVRKMLGLGTFQFLTSGRLLRTIFREISRADLTVVSYARELTPLLSVLMCVIRGRPFVLRTHGMIEEHRRGIVRFSDTVVTRPLARRALAIFALTSVERGQLNGWLRKRGPEIVVQPNIVEAPAANSRPSEFEVLFLGRLHPRKRVGDFIEAARLVRERGLGCRFAVVGPPGPDMPRVESAAQRGDIVYEGAVRPETVAARVANSSVFVLPSLNEPFGNVLVQAFAAGVPVIATESCHLAAEIRARDAAIIVPDGAPEELAKAVERLAADGDLYSALSAQGKRYYEEVFEPAKLGQHLASQVHRWLAVRPDPSRSR